jgi:phospholipase/carboxylesterase
MHRVTTQLGPLRCHVVQQEPGTKARLAAIFCHGYGAPGDDLVGLAEELVRLRPSLASVRFFFPEAPLTLEELGMPQGRAWWHIDLEKRMRLEALGPEGEAALREEIPDGLAQSRRRLLALLGEVAQSATLPFSRIVLGGFSQGAMLATDTCLALDEAPAGLAILSGTLISAQDWRAKAPRRRGLPVVQTHGQVDPLLSFRGAEALRALLEGAGLNVTFEPFAGGHTIPMSALHLLADLLEQRLAP